MAIRQWSLQSGVVVAAAVQELPKAKHLHLQELPKAILQSVEAASAAKSAASAARSVQTKTSQQSTWKKTIRR